MSPVLDSPRFQSTHPRGVRHPSLKSTQICTLVSIHAPTRGATLLNLTIIIFFIKFQSTHPRGVRLHSPSLSLFALKRFNPRTHEGCDWHPASPYRWMKEFQSTHPRGVRLVIILLSSCSTTKFQSTHPRGVRLAAAKSELQKLDVSIHAPTRGATSKAVFCSEAATVSIHAPTRGATD